MSPKFCRYLLTLEGYQSGDTIVIPRRGESEGYFGIELGIKKRGNINSPVQLHFLNDLFLRPGDQVDFNKPVALPLATALVRLLTPNLL